MYDILLQECVSNDVMCSYLHSLSDLDAHAELQCLYVHKVKECECLVQKLSKQTETVSIEVYNELLRSFAKLEKYSISLELSIQQCQEQMKNDTVCKEKHQMIASQVGVSHDLTKPVTPHSWPQVKKSSFAKPYDVNAPGPFSNSPKHVSFQSSRESVGSNDMVHNYYLEKAKKKAQLQKDKALNTKPSVQQSARLPNTANGQRFSPNKSSNVYLKTTPPRSGLTWKPTVRIFSQVGLKWIPIRKSVETRYNTNDSASPLGKETHNPKTVICANSFLLVHVLQWILNPSLQRVNPT
ncbi:hypothetical protein Tco_1214789 [Tanacetum coccineum]